MLSAIMFHTKILPDQVLRCKRALKRIACLPFGDEIKAAISGVAALPIVIYQVAIRGFNAFNIVPAKAPNCPPIWLETPWAAFTAVPKNILITC